MASVNDVQPISLLVVRIRVYLNQLVQVHLAFGLHLLRQTSEILGLLGVLLRVLPTQT